MPQRHTELFSSFPFSIPDLYNDIPGQKNQTLWIDLFVPSERTAAPPGRYTTGLYRKRPGGKEPNAGVGVGPGRFGPSRNEELADACEGGGQFGNVPLWVFN
jgi:hypothetical protein